MGAVVNSEAMMLRTERNLIAPPSFLEAWLQRLSTSLDTAGDLNQVLDDMLRSTRTAQPETAWIQSDIVMAQQKIQAAEARIHELETELARMSGLAREDQLTGSLNRRGIDDVLERELARSERKNLPLCVALLDLDDFKKLNDTYGHNAGDAVLVHLVRVVKETLRATDVIGRFGGEEFLIVLTDTPLDEAAQAIMRVQRELNKQPLMYGNQQLPISFSAGVTLCEADEERAVLIARADKALYEAKKAGKNRVVNAE